MCRENRYLYKSKVFFFTTGELGCLACRSFHLHTIQLSKSSDHITQLPFIMGYLEVFICTFHE